MPSSKKSVGSMCVVPAECISGFCVDGYCCDGPCDGICVACNIAGSHGRCSPAAAKSDPHGSCVGDTGCGGLCDGNFKCSFQMNGMVCDVCKVCDGSGHCNQLPSKEDDDRCGNVSCAGLSTECVSFDDVTMRRCVSVGLCVDANDPASCTQSHAVPDGTPCSTGACSGGQCVDAMDLGATGGKSGGCSVAAAPSGTGSLLLLLCVALALRVRRRRG
jgi:hypothetical protein